MRFPFEATPEELEEHLDEFVDVVFSSLESEFLVMPRGAGFVEYPLFEDAFQRLRKATGGFARFEVESVLAAIAEKPLCLIVLRTILGLTPPEWAFLASRRSATQVTQNYARSLDRKIRVSPTSLLRSSAGIEALVRTACQLLTEIRPGVAETQIHRLDKADTREGLDSIRHLSNLGVPYPMLLYERFLGRPFASHRDSVSELVGNPLEAEIERQLDRFGVAFRKMTRSGKIPGFDQSPDFVVPDEFNPKVVIEAKLTQDDGTARDKVTRVQHLAEISKRGSRGGSRSFQVIACIAGRGFGVRREEMKKLILGTEGKVFSFRQMDRLVDHSALRGFVTREP